MTLNEKAVGTEADRRIYSQGMDSMPKLQSDCSMVKYPMGRKLLLVDMNQDI